jgi:hypothetical protein
VALVPVPSAKGAHGHGVTSVAADKDELGRCRVAALSQCDKLEAVGMPFAHTGSDGWASPVAIS